MYGKFLQIILLSVTMASFFIPGLTNLNYSLPHAQAESVLPEKTASGDQSSVFKVYIPLTISQPVEEISSSDPLATGTPENNPQPTPVPTATAVNEKPMVKLAMEMDYHSQRWETSLKNACGPASLLMVLDYFGKAQPLPEVIQSFSLAPSQGGFDPNCQDNPVCLSAGVLEEIAHNTYKMAVEAHEDWTLEQVYQALENDQPVIADVTFRLEAGGPGHFVVIYGLDPDKKEIYYHDPFDGASQTASWDQFSASWNGPVDVDDPLQPAGHQGWGMALSAQ